MNANFKFLIPLFRRAPIVLLSILVSCGGGGGGSDPSSPSTQPAYVNLEVNPTSIDTGNRFIVFAYVQEINPDGIFLKIRTPISVLYISNSGTLEVNGQVSEIHPDFYQSDGTYNYLVYKLDSSMVPSGYEGKVTVQYEADAAVSSGLIAIDADFNDPKIPDALEFDVKNPEFTPLKSVSVTVLG